MTQDEIIEMAIKLGAGCYTPPPNTLVKGITMTFDQLETFTKLVAMRTLEGTYDEIIDIVLKDEREACAKACEEEGKMWSKAGCTNTQTFALCATVIRERGKA